MQEGEGSPGRAAAVRLLSLRRKDESPAEFARRLDLTDQILDNYIAKRNGLGLAAVGKIAPYLTDSELLWVVAGRRPASSEAEAAAYASGLREAFAATREALDGVEAMLGATPQQADPNVPLSGQSEAASPAPATAPPRPPGAHLATDAANRRTAPLPPAGRKGRRAGGG